jgi:hypothetical protein
MAAGDMDRPLEHLLLQCHVIVIPARISDHTTAMIVVFLMSSYEESVNMSRCIANGLRLPLKRSEALSSPQVHEFSGYSVCRSELSTI